MLVDIGDLIHFLETDLLDAFLPPIPAGMTGAREYSDGWEAGVRHAIDRLKRTREGKVWGT